MTTNYEAPKAAQDDPLRLRPLRLSAAREARCEQGHQHRWPDLPNLCNYRPTDPRAGEPASKKQLKDFRWYGFEQLRPLTRGEAKCLLRQIEDWSQHYRAIPTPHQEAELRSQGRWRDGMTREEADKEQWAATCEAFTKAARAHDSKRNGTAPRP